MKILFRVSVLPILVVVAVVTFIGQSYMKIFEWLIDGCSDAEEWWFGGGR